MTQYARLTFIDSSSDYSDYRPAVGPDGNTIIFERTPVDGSAPTQLYVVDALLNITSAQPFLPNPPSDAEMQTRPDWCWQAGMIAFNGAGKDAGIQIFVCDRQGGQLTSIDDTDSCIYPSWSSDGSQLAVMNTSDTALPKPSSTMIDLGGVVIYPNLNGSDANGVAMFGGMPAVSPVDSNQIAFAGQPELASWNKPPTSTLIEYDQAANYIFLNQYNGAFTSAPLESGASITAYDPSFQGRAPAWSPDGRYVAFESDRSGRYAIYLFDTQSRQTIGPVTDPAWNAQHAKFYPDGDRLILAAFQNAGGNKGPWGVAQADISAFLA